MYGQCSERKSSRPDILLPFPVFNISCSIRGKELGVTCSPPGQQKEHVFIAFSLSTAGMIVCVKIAHQAILHKSFECAFITSSGEALCVMHQEHLATWRIGEWNGKKGPDLLDTQALLSNLETYVQQDKSLDSIPLITLLANQRHLCIYSFITSICLFVCII